MHFTLRFPIALAERARRQHTILVMSEDSDWRAVVQRVLEQGGYEVLTARHAGHALVSWMRREGTIDLLLSEGEPSVDFTALAPRMVKEDRRMRWLHLERRPGSAEDLLAAVDTALAAVKGAA